jgi:hypothetical protein
VCYQLLKSSELAVFGWSNSDEEREVFDLYVAGRGPARDGSNWFCGFCKGLDAGVFGAFESAGVFEKKDFKLFSFKEFRVRQSCRMDDIAARREAWEVCSKHIDLV